MGTKFQFCKIKSSEVFSFVFCFLFWFFCVFVFVFLGPHSQYMEISRLGSSNQSCSCWPMPQPQQCGIWAASAAYTPAHGNARSLTHWARPGIKHAISWLLAGFLSTETQWELLLRILDKIFLDTCYSHLPLILRKPVLGHCLSLKVAVFSEILG